MSDVMRKIVFINTGTLARYLRRKREPGAQ